MMRTNSQLLQIEVIALFQDVANNLKQEKQMNDNSPSASCSFSFRGFLLYIFTATQLNKSHLIKFIKIELPRINILKLLFAIVSKLVQWP